MKRALIAVDVQNDFMPGGNLPVTDGDEIVPVVNGLIEEHDLVIFTQDFHPADHKSFASQHPGKNAFDVVDLNGIDQVLWPDHCVQGSEGVRFHKDLSTAKAKSVYIFKKGTNSEVDSYSGFYDNNHEDSTGLAEFLKENGVEAVEIVGLAGDYCVKFTALDAVKEGFNTTVIGNGVRFIDEDITKHVEEMREAGVNYI